MTVALGKISFSDTPDVGGVLVLTTATGLAQGSITGMANEISIGGTAAAPILGIADNPVFTGTEGIQIPNGTTAQRPAVPTLGDMRYNTTNAEPEIYNGSAWLPFARSLQVFGGNVGQVVSTSWPAYAITTNVAPSATGGTVIFTPPAFTPTSTTSRVDFAMSFSVSTGTAARAALFILVVNGVIQGGASTYCTVVSNPVSVSLQAQWTPGALTSQVMTVRAYSLTTATNFAVNQTTVQTWGNALTSSYSIRETL